MKKSNKQILVFVVVASLLFSLSVFYTNTNQAEEHISAVEEIEGLSESISEIDEVVKNEEVRVVGELKSGIIKMNDAKVDDIEAFVSNVTARDISNFYSYQYNDDIVKEVLSSDETFIPETSVEFDGTFPTIFNFVNLTETFKEEEKEFPNNSYEEYSIGMFSFGNRNYLSYVGDFYSRVDENKRFLTMVGLNDDDNFEYTLGFLNHFYGEEELEQLMSSVFTNDKYSTEFGYVSFYNKDDGVVFDLKEAYDNDGDRYVITGINSIELKYLIDEGTSPTKKLVLAMEDKIYDNEYPVKTYRYRVGDTLEVVYGKDSSIEFIEYACNSEFLDGIRDSYLTLGNFKKLENVWVVNVGDDELLIQRNEGSLLVSKKVVMSDEK